jgi:acyl-CoA thioester hydrolase
LPIRPAAPARCDFSFWWPVAVRWGDMDAMGHVNNSVYFQYLESARVGYFEAAGWNSRDTSPTRQGPVVVSQTFNYRRQLGYPADVEVGVACTEMRQRSFVLSYGLFRKGSDELFGDGTSVLVWLDYAAGRAVELPPDLREYLTQRENGDGHQRKEEG